MNKKSIFFLITVILITLFSTAIVNATLNDAELYYSFNDDNLSGSNPLDLSGNSYTGTNTGAITGATGLLNEAFTYDGSDDVSTNNQILDGTNNQYWTSCGWYKRSGTGYYRLNGNYDSSKGFEINWKDDGDFHLGGKDNSGSTYQSYVSTFNVAASNTDWNFVCVGQDDYYPIVSINGGTIEKSGTRILNNGGSISTGDYTIGTNAASSTPFIGSIDETSIYLRTLTQSEINELYNSGSGYNPYTTTPIIKYTEEIFWDEQGATTRIISTGVNTTIISNSITITNDTYKIYGSGTIQMYSPNTASVTCNMLFENVVVATGSRTNLGGTFGSMNLMSENTTLSIGNNNVEIQCIKNSGAWIDIGYTVGVGHVIKNNTAYYYQDIYNSSLTINNAPIEDQTLEIPYDGFVIIDWSNIITNNEGSSQEVITKLVTNKGNCSSFIRDIGAGNSASTGGSCSFNVTQGDNFTAGLYVTGTNIDIHHHPHLKILSQANSTILGNETIITTPTKISELTINNTNSLDLIYMKAGLPIDNSGSTVYFYFKSGSTTTQETPKTASTGTEVLITQDVLTATSGVNTIELWAYTSTGTANLKQGDFQIYPTNQFETNSTSFNVSTYNIWDNEVIQNFSVTYDTIRITTTTGTATIFTVDQELINLTITSDNFLNKTILNHNTSNNLNTSLKQSEINFTLEEYYTNNSISDWTLYNDTDELYNSSTYYAIMNLPEGTYNDLKIVSNTGIFTDKYPESFTVAIKDNKTITRNIYVYDMNFTANYIIDNSSINNFTIYLSSYNRTDIRNITTTNGYAVIGGVIGDIYNITIDAENYALENNEYNLTLTNHTNYTFYLYTENSIFFYLYDEITGNIILETMYIEMTGNTTNYIFNTSTGSYYKDGIIDGVYSIKIYNGNYNPKYYSITVGNRSYQTLNAYLSTDYQSAIFTFYDKSSNELLQDVLFTQSRVINGSWSVVSTKLSDITGRIPASYLTDVTYRITLTKSGYTTKTFELDPFLFDTYSVKMERTSSTGDLRADLSISFTPQIFYEGNNTLMFTLTSPTGSLTSYWVNISYPDSYNYSSGSNSIGEVFQIDFNISNPEILDKVIINYHYETTTGENETKQFIYAIIPANAWFGTFSQNKLETYGLGVGERIFLTVLAVIIVSGFAYMVAGAGGALITTLAIYGFTVSSGFIPFWSVVITFFVGIILIIKVTTR